MRTINITVAVKQRKNAMTNFLAGWIVLQLLVVGLVGGSIVNEIAADKYECGKPLEYAPMRTAFISAVLPLAFFLPGDGISKDYCANKAAASTSTPATN